jgi:hypothetical protein
MSVYLAPKTIFDKIDKIRRNFFWQGGGTKRKYYLVKWIKICKSKKKGGLGIKDLKKMNVSLVSKWWWKLEKDDGLWQDIVKAKYLHNKSIFSVTHKAFDSPVWSDLLKVRDLYLHGRSVKICNGHKTSFWCNTWLYDKPLSDITPVLFTLCDQKEAKVYQVKNGLVQITFRRWLTNELLNYWDFILSDVHNFEL